MNVGDLHPVNQEPVSPPITNTPNTNVETPEQTEKMQTISEKSLTIPERTSDHPVGEDHSVKTTLNEPSKTTSGNVDTNITPRLVEKKEIRAKKEEINNTKSEISKFEHEIKNTSPNINTQNQLNEANEKLSLLEKQLKFLQENKDRSQLSPAKLEAVTTIFNTAIGYLEEPLDEQGEKKLKAEIFQEISKLSKSSSRSFEVGNTTFTATKGALNDSKSIEIGFISEQLGAGTFGNAYLIQHLTSDKTQAMKIANADEKSVADVRNEFKMLNYVHTQAEKLGLDTSGIQEKPHSLVQLNLAGTIREGFLGHLYNAGNAVNLMDVDSQFFSQDFSIAQQQIEKVVDRVLSGLDTLKQLGVYHGDIKPGNMFLHLDENTSEVRVVLADFGGTNTFENFANDFINSTVEYPPNSTMFLRGATKPFFSEILMNKIDEQCKSPALIALLSESPKDTAKLLDFFNENIKPLAEKNDAYATGISLFNILTQNYNIIEIPGYSLKGYTESMVTKDNLILNLKEDIYTALVSEDNKDIVDNMDDPNEILPFVEKIILPKQKEMADNIINMILGGT